MAYGTGSRNAGKFVVLGAIILAAAGTATTSLFLASPDRCLVGRWRVTNSTSFPRAGTLELQSNGAAQLTELQEAPYGAIWKTTSNLLEINFVSRQRPDVEETEGPGVTWRLRWKILEVTPEILHLEGPTNGHWTSGRVSLSRQ